MEVRIEGQVLVQLHAVAGRKDDGRELGQKERRDTGTDSECRSHGTTGATLRHTRHTDYPYLVLIRYCARFTDSGVPAITTCDPWTKKVRLEMRRTHGLTVRSLDPSSVLEIFIVAPDSCLWIGGQSVISFDPMFDSPNLIDLRSSLSDDTADQFVWNAHLLRRRRLRARLLSGNGRAMV